ncbi:hypothetical protein MTO96_008975 [Rhipicephalus appendiculatus]
MIDEQLPVMYQGLQKRDYKFNINGCHKESTDEYWGDKTGLNTRKYVKACQFDAHIAYDGYFGYTVSNIDEGNFEFVLVNITVLAEISESFEVSNGKLGYTAKGYYVERITCYDSAGKNRDE